MGTAPPGTRRVAGWCAAGGAPTVSCHGRPRDLAARAGRAHRRAVVLFAFGATKAVGLLTERTDTRTRMLAAAPTIVVHTGTGDVRIVAADRTDVRLTTKEKRSIWGGGHVRVSGDAARPAPQGPLRRLPGRRRPLRRGLGPRGAAGHQRAGGHRHGRSAGREPAGRRRAAAAGTGDLHAVGVSGPLRLSSETGDVHVEGPSPDVVARTSTGDIRVEASRPRTIHAAGRHR